MFLSILEFCMSFWSHFNCNSTLCIEQGSVLRSSLSLGKGCYSVISDHPWMLRNSLLKVYVCQNNSSELKLADCLIFLSLTWSNLKCFLLFFYLHCCELEGHYLELQVLRKTYWSLHSVDTASKWFWSFYLCSVCVCVKERYCLELFCCFCATS